MEVLWRIVKNRQCSHQISHVTATFISLVNGLWEVKDDLVFPKRRGSQDNEKETEEGRMKEGPGETESIEKEGGESKGEGVSLTGMEVSAALQLSSLPSCTRLLISHHLLSCSFLTSL